MARPEGSHLRHVEDLNLAGYRRIVCRWLVVDGNTHAVHGILLAELVFLVARRRLNGSSSSLGGFSRAWAWFLGALGGWSIDMDGISGVAENVLTGARPWTADLVYVYHREFSHGIAVLAVTAACLAACLLAYRRRPATGLPPRDLHVLPPVLGIPRPWLRAVAIAALVAAYAMYGAATRFLALAAILLAMVLVAWTFIDAGQPLHGIIFFAAAMLHHLADAIQCEWNPLGPWAPDVEIGFFLYCGGRVETPRNAFFFTIFEIVPHVLLAIVALRLLARHRRAPAIASPRREEA